MHAVFLQKSMANIVLKKGKLYEMILGNFSNNSSVKPFGFEGYLDAHK